MLLSWSIILADSCLSLAVMLPDYCRSLWITLAVMPTMANDDISSSRMSFVVFCPLSDTLRFISSTYAIRSSSRMDVSTRFRFVSSDFIILSFFPPAAAVVELEFPLTSFSVEVFLLVVLSRWSFFFFSFATTYFSIFEVTLSSFSRTFSAFASVLLPVFSSLPSFLSELFLAAVFYLDF